MTRAANTTRPWPATPPAEDALPTLNGAPLPTVPVPDTGRAWLRNAMAALAVLAAAAAVVSWDAQYVMVRQVKHVPVISALEAGIPDAGALIFAALGIALALHGRRALRPRTLNVACVGLSLAMNAMAAGSGWRDTAIWVMPAAVYALASDTLIGGFSRVRDLEGFSFLLARWHLAAVMCAQQVSGSGRWPRMRGLRAGYQRRLSSAIIRRLASRAAASSSSRSSSFLRRSRICWRRLSACCGGRLHRRGRRARCAG